HERRSRPWSAIWLFLGVLAAATVSLADRLPSGYLDEKRSSEILAKTVTIRLDPDLSQLTPGERDAVGHLLEAGTILQDLYEKSRHRDAKPAYAELVRLDAELGHPAATGNLIDLYRLARGPVIRDLDNRVLTILPVEKAPPGRAVYPWNVDKKEIEEYLARFPGEKSSLLAERTVVRRGTREDAAADLAVLDAQPVLDFLHPGLRAGFEAVLREGSKTEFYAVPYSVAYAPELLRVYDLLWKAAGSLEGDDPDFARYLRHRAVDLLRDDYEAGDASWVTGRFRNLNAQIGSYETYDDGLYGVKSFFGMSILVRDPGMDSSVNTVKSWLPDMEELLPYEPHKKVRTDIPVGAYNVIADFGQARGTNTATILPNESDVVRKYGRTILLRNNVISDRAIFEMRKAVFDAAVADEFHGDYDGDGDFFRTLWHEIGHYLGPDATRAGETLDTALEEDSSILEELKADLVSLYVSKALFKKGYYNRPRLRAVQTAGIRRVLLKNEPRKAQVYETMELMQLNYYLEKGLLAYDDKSGKLSIRYDVYHETIEAMLRETLALQQAGDKKAADDFIAKYSLWKKDLHERLARKMKDSEAYRYVLVRYAALGE
ncbi:MAG: hydrolase, partial [Candidatus Krumholzibacteriota bacterium]|nr:hydrolase [Candidatus Krumholzibacteriota bacterium]